MMPTAPMGAPPAGPDPAMMMGAPEPEPSAEGGESPSDWLRNAIEFAQLAQTTEKDDVRSQKISKAIALLYEIFATQQKDRDKVMGLSSGMRGALGG